MIARNSKAQVNNWIENGDTALMLSGARQIGKTYLIRECLKESEYPYEEFNFIEQPELITLFESVKTTEELITRLSVVSKKPLEKGKTIFFFDEVQECKEIITRIKFLVEDGNYRYIMSGSLLGVEINDLRSAPVGFLEIVDMYPLSFEEFAKAIGVQDTTIKLLQQCFEEQKRVDDFIHEKMLDVFYLYLIVGGMPEAVATYTETNDLKQVGMIHEKIIRLYKTDFSKYEKRYKLKLEEIYDAMASELDQKNKRFMLNNLGKGTNYEQVKENFLWLKNAGGAIPVYNVQEPKEPLKLSENRSLFKLFFSDVGLLTSQYADEVKIRILQKDVNINNGSLFENAAAQEFVCNRLTPYYFNSKKQGEVDFVLELNGRVNPIEIKSGKDYKKHSALTNILADEVYEINTGYVFSNGNVEREGKKLYLPVYMLMFLKNAEMSNTIYKIDLSGL